MKTQSERTVQVENALELLNDGITSNNETKIKEALSQVDKGFNWNGLEVLKTIWSETKVEGNSILKNIETERAYNLQKLDCNCNDCGFLTRNLDAFNKSLKLHEKWQLGYFNGIKERLIETANFYKNKRGDLARWDTILDQVEKLKFQFDKSTCKISYGTCSKFNKDVSFLPNTCQIETQDCFVHRKDLM